MQNLQALFDMIAETWHMPVSEVGTLLSLKRQKSLRINTLSAKKSTLKSFQKNGIALELIPWAPDCYMVKKGYEFLPSHRTVLDGEAYLQDAASFLPALALEPKAGDVILDMAAAPGGKASHIAMLAKNKAQLTVNDTSRTRFFRMRDLLENMSVNANYTLYDGRFARKHFKDVQFDKILLDAPCSGEASINPDTPKSYNHWSMAKVKRLSRLQEQLIIAAFDVLKDSGTLVYSTCTINPYENELVVERLLKRRHAKLQHINITVPHARPGLTVWKDKKLSQDIQKVVRLMPSAVNEAFFVAKIGKKSGSTDEDTVYF